MLTPQRPPPEDYYQNNCSTLFRHVLARHHSLLSKVQRAQLERYLEAGDDAQRLFARLLSRKGPIVRIDSLQYQEVVSVTGAIEELMALELVQRNGLVAADVLLNKLRKSELLEVAHCFRSLAASNTSVRQSPKALKKAELIEWLLHGRADALLDSVVRDMVEWLVIASPDTWEIAQFLYFGGMSQDWSAFIMRDLGLVDYERPNLDTPLFADLGEFEQARQIVYLSALSRRVDDHPELLPELVRALTPLPTHRYAIRRRDRALLSLGRWCERHGEHTSALGIYDMVRLHPARERSVRILHKCAPQQADSLLAELRRAPRCDEELQFAERFGRRGGGFQPTTRTVHIEQAHADIEEQALEILLTGGVEGCEPLWGAHVENSLLRTLTGLIYWPIIFADVSGAFTNPFQSAPNDLFEDDFCAVREEALTRLESSIQDDEALHRHLTTIVVSKRGIANRLVNWSLLSNITLEELLDAIPLTHIRSLSAFLIRNLASRRSGLPDLLVVYGPKEYEFIEVKGPSDQLQPGQRVWFSHFERLGIPASVLKLNLSRSSNTN